MTKRLTYFKAALPDGTDFRTGTVDYGSALATGEAVRHPRKAVKDDPGTYLSVSVEPAEALIGGTWPCRLFRVEPVGRTLASSQYPSKRGVSALRVVEELPSHLALGPNGAAVAAVIERAGRLTEDEIGRLFAARDAAWYAVWGAAQDAAWDVAQDAAQGAARYAAWIVARNAARGAAWDAARDVARDAARDAAQGAAQGVAWGAALYAAWDEAWGSAWDAARGAAGYAAVAILTRDLITNKQYQILAGPWLTAIKEER